jgi:putative Mg2+ transporter-C (MgtC) family protein
MISHLEMIGRIAAGAALGGIIGYERDVHGRPVGLRTHLIVAMAAATFMVVSSQFVFFQHYGHDDLVAVDSSRIAASVVSGIGFLAGGAILRTGIAVQGLTTAAGLWLVTAIGMSSGAGMFLVASVVTAMGVFALTVLRRFEDKKDNVIRRRISVVIGDETLSFPAIFEALGKLGAEVSHVVYERRFDEEKKQTKVTFDVQVAQTTGLAEIIAKLEQLPKIHRVRVEHPG